MHPCNADFFRRQGWTVDERQYGTRIYQEMFTLFSTDGYRMFEIRRNPFATGNGIFTPRSTHIRLRNRYCYDVSPIALLRDFLVRYDYQLHSIYRIDVCMDFERFDDGTKPSEFVARYMKHRYSKINQCTLNAHGSDLWDGRIWNSLKWGNPTSMVTTKLYNKTMELARAGADKPYIRHAWFDARLIDDPVRCIKVTANGTTYKPDIWRVEFSIKASSAKWYVIEDCNGKRKKKRSMPNTLDVYDTKEKLIQVFASLAHHYFHFKHFEEGVRKDRCKDKEVFKFTPGDTACKLSALASDRPQSNDLQKLISRLCLLMANTLDLKVKDACAVLIDLLQSKLMASDLANPWDATQLTALRLLISQRFEGQNPSLSVLKDQLRQLDIFLEK